ncbi:MAG TPA: (2Fe-2S)-binding protein [Patescibacteria group bacterium]|nr:(2Fe-2S)-binding protein [Patescibacteria group bacterium]
MGIRPRARSNSDLGVPSDLDLRTSNLSLAMADQIHLSVNGQRISVTSGTVVAAAIAQTGVTTFRRSISGQARGPLCGMGTCMECRVTVNGQPHCRSCQTLCAEGMEVRTDE